MSILITGGTGYIGSHVAVEIIKSGRDIVIADNLSNSSVDIIDKIKIITGVCPKFYNIDVANQADVEKIFGENDITAVLHFAGYKSISESIAQPVEYYSNNIDTTLVLLKVMGKYGCNKFIFSSSATVYGEHNISPLTEDMITEKCTNPYGWTKLMIEQMLTDITKANPDISVVILRYFNPIGAHESGLIGEKPNGVPNNLMPYITQVALGIREKLYVFGNDYDTKDGTGVRDYIHVVDLAKGHLAALEYSEKHTGDVTINLGTGIGHSVLEVVNTFKKVNGVNIPYVILPRRPGDIDTCYANADKAAKLLGWHAEKELEVMCCDAWRWQQNCK